MHDHSFTTLIRKIFECENLPGELRDEYDPCKLFGFAQIKEGIGSTHRGILETYTTSFNSKSHQLESRAWLAKSENRI